MTSDVAKFERKKEKEWRTYRSNNSKIFFSNEMEVRNVGKLEEVLISKKRKVMSTSFIQPKNRYLLWNRNFKSA